MWINRKAHKELLKRIDDLQIQIDLLKAETKIPVPMYKTDSISPWQHYTSIPIKDVVKDLVAHNGLELTYHHASKESISLTKKI